MIDELYSFPDDYITKPYSMRELAARVKANLRRSATVPVVKESEPENQDTIISGDLAINVERYEVSKNGQTIDITLREFELLKFLAMQPEKIFSREKLLENVNTLMEAIVKAKPSTLKGQYLKSITLAPTMGPGVKVSTLKY